MSIGQSNPVSAIKPRALIYSGSLQKSSSSAKSDSPLKICAPILFLRIVRLQSQDSPDQDHRGFARSSYCQNHSVLGKKMYWCGELWPYSNITTLRAGSSKERDGITHVAPSLITSTSVRAADSFIPRCTNRTFGRLVPRISTLDLCTL